MKTVRLASLAMAVVMFAWGKQASAPTDVTVYVENGAVDNDVMAYAQFIAGKMFAGIGVHVAWTARPAQSAAGVAAQLRIENQRYPEREPAGLGYAFPYATGMTPAPLARPKAVEIPPITVPSFRCI